MGRWILLVLVLGTSCAGKQGQVGEGGVVGPSDQDSSLGDRDADSGGAAADSGDAEFDPKDAAADSGDAEFDPTKGWVQHQIYKCCPQGEGRSCCVPGEPYALCVEYQTCIEEDETFDPKSICSACCRGLRPIITDYRWDDGACGPGPFVAKVCTKCGDGVCAGSENSCNCPSDCGE